MSGSEGERLAQLATAIRESTLRRLYLVPRGLEIWSPAPDLLSFADIADHLTQSDQWLLRILSEKKLKPISAEPGQAEVANRSEFRAILDRLESIGTAKEDHLRRMTTEQLTEILFDERFGGEVSAWWVISRGNLDHEAHHRGQLALYLKLIRP